MKRCLLVFWLCCCGFSPSFAAPKALPKKAPLPPGNRFLFVVETSATMPKVEHAGRQAVVDLIYSGVDGRMRAGDTYGLWTFNEQTHAGLFPMQTWKPAAALDLASRAGLFLKSQPYENRPNVGATVKKLMAVIKAVGDVTIFVISDGSSPFEGTAFDRYINASYQERDEERRRARKPFVTTLVARGGELMIGTVTIAGEVIQLPESPEPVQVVQAPNNDPDSVQPKSASSTNRVIHIVAPPPRRAETPKPPSTDIAFANLAPAREANDPSLAAATNLPTAASADTTTAPSTAATGLSANPATPSPQENVPTVAARGTASAPDHASQGQQENPTESAPAQPEGPNPLASLLPAPLTIAARENSEGASPAAAKSKAIAPLTAMTAPPESMFSPRGMLIIGAALLAVAIGLIALFIWKARSLPQPSFISRSMDRK